MNCGIAHKLGSDLELLWLWCRLVATAPIRPLAREPPSAVGVVLKIQKKKKKKPTKFYLAIRFSPAGVEKRNLD